MSARHHHDDPPWTAITLEEYNALMADRDRPLTAGPMAKRQATLDPPPPAKSILDWLIDGGGRQ